MASSGFRRKSRSRTRSRRSQWKATPPQTTTCPKVVSMRRSNMGLAGQ